MYQNFTWQPQTCLCRESGAAMVELAIVITSFFWLVLTPFQICDAIGYRERLANLSQESANVAFRDCATKVNDRSVLTACVKSVAQITEQIVREQFPNAKFTIVVNIFKPGAFPPNYPIASSWDGGCGRRQRDCPAKFRGKEFRRAFNRQHDPREPSVLAEQDILAISELDLKPAFTLPSLLTIGGTNEFHETGIY